MFGFNKQELYLGQFVNLILQSILKSKAADSLPNDGYLSNKEIKQFKQELFYLRVQLLMAKLMEIRRFGKTEFSNEKIGKTVGTAVVLALRDTDVQKNESEKIVNSLLKRIEIYEDFITGLSTADLQKTGVYFQILQCFTELVLGRASKRVLSEASRDKEFTVFSYGKQIYKSDEEAFKQTIKSVKFLD